MAEDRPLTHREFTRYVRGSVTGYLILFAGLLGSVWYTANESHNSNKAIVRSGSAVEVDGCNRDFTSMTVQLDTIRSRRTNLILLTKPEDKGAGYRQALRNLSNNESQLEAAIPDCRDAAKVVTDDPSSVTVTPPPLHR